MDYSYWNTPVLYTVLYLLYEYMYRRPFLYSYVLILYVPGTGKLGEDRWIAQTRYCIQNHTTVVQNVNTGYEICVILPNVAPEVEYCQYCS